MNKVLSPSDPEYFSKPKSWRDRYTLKRFGWRELTEEEKKECLELIKSSNPGVHETISQNGRLGEGASLRWYEGRGVCVYVKKTDCFFELKDGKEPAISLDDLKKISKKGQFIGRNI